MKPALVAVVLDQCVSLETLLENLKPNDGEIKILIGDTKAEIPEALYKRITDKIGNKPSRHSKLSEGAD